MTGESRASETSAATERGLEPTLPCPGPSSNPPATLAAPSCRPEVERAPGLPAPGERIDDFELLQVLGEGSFGRVFLARQLSLERQVALKVTSNYGSEARTLASLEHDHIVQVFSETVDRARDVRLLCMQYVPGTTLQRIIEELGSRPRADLDGQAIVQALDRLTLQPVTFHPTAVRDRALLEDADFVEAVCLLGARLAEALDYAHRQGILHRDIKPANILVTPYGRPLLADFNLSSDTRRVAALGHESVGGTLAYMAPEHLDAFNPDVSTPPEAIDRRSDIYSLGVVLYELLKGKRPFRSVSLLSSDDALGDMARERREKPPSPQRDWPGVPPAMAYMVVCCLDPDPAQRYQTAGELARALEGCRELQRISRELPRPGPIGAVALRRPFTWLAVFTLLPHLIGSLVNISYNRLRIVDAWDAVPRGHFAEIVLVYNLVVYPICILAIFWLVRPIYRVWRGLNDGDLCDPGEVTAMRRRALTLPRWAVILSCFGWLPGGLIFPLAIYLMEREASPITAASYTHFVISFTTSGLIALTYSYFAAQVVALRVFYPRFWVSPQSLRAKITQELTDRPPRLWLFQLLAGVIPLTGAILLLVAGPEVLSGWMFRVLGVGLILLGMAGFGLAVLANQFLSQTLAVLTRKGVQHRALPGEDTSWNRKRPAS
jgi:eukaryotic-like serine/threonine-protein kinase